MIQKTAKFMNKTLSEDQVHQLADHLSFGNMKSNPAINLETFARIERERHGLSEQPDLQFIRQGETGGWRKDMTQAGADRLDAWTESRLHGTDYDPELTGTGNALDQVVTDDSDKETNSLP